MNFQTGSLLWPLAIALSFVQLLSFPDALVQRSIAGKVGKVAGGSQFVEGPVWKNGYSLLFSDTRGDSDRKTLYITSGHAVSGVRPVITALITDSIPPLTPEPPFLSPNFPNPCNFATTVHFTVPVTGRVTLRLLDLLGRVVLTQVDEDRIYGAYEEKIDASRLASGFYVCQLLEVSGTATGKILVIK